MKNNLIKSLIYGTVFSSVVHFQTFAEVTKNDILRNLSGETVVYEHNTAFITGKTYVGNNNTDNNIIYMWGSRVGWQDALFFACTTYNSENHQEKSTGWTGRNITINGEAPSWTTAINSSYETLDFDENGKLQARYSGSGQLLSTYRYAEDGQMLVYNPQGELTGAYGNFYDQLMAGSPWYDKKSELNHLSEDGNYVAKDGDKILGIYQRDGSKTEYQYDAGGNLISSYKNGIVTYRRRIYTPAEATAAVQKGGKNNFSLTFR